MYTGPISEGTLDLNDLVERFTAALDELDTGDRFIALREEAHQVEDYETKAHVLNKLADALNDLAVEHGCYFSAHEDDGSCFGFWRITGIAADLDGERYTLLTDSRDVEAVGERVDPTDWLDYDDPAVVFVAVFTNALNYDEVWACSDNPPAEDSIVWRVK